MSNEIKRQILMDLDNFLQREGVDMDLSILRTKLRLLNHNLEASKPKTIVRGILITMNRTNKKLLVIKMIDIIQWLRKKYNFEKVSPKLSLDRLTKPLDIIIWLENSYPLKLEYSS
jgi:hypothetical protein